MKSEKIKRHDKIGWREWVALPELGIPAIKAKIDTGARTSSLHAFHLETFKENGRDMVKFSIHPLQKRTDIEIICTEPVKDARVVKDSGGHAEERYVIETPVQIGDKSLPIEITLTSREDMVFRMLLGRTAIIDGLYTVNPEESYLMGKTLRNAYKKHNTERQAK